MECKYSMQKHALDSFESFVVVGGRVFIGLRHWKRRWSPRE